MFELSRGVKQASPSYLKNHQRFFDYTLNTLTFPVAQHVAVGFVRSPVDRQKIYDWMTDLSQKAIKFGQVAYSDNSKEAEERIAGELRKIAFAPSS